MMASPGGQTDVGAVYADGAGEPTGLSNTGIASKTRAIRVAFVGHAAAVVGGAELTLLTHIPFTAADIVPTVILFEDGPYADKLRRLSIPVEIIPAPKSITESRREKPRLDAAFAALVHASQVARRLRELRIDVLYGNTFKANFICGLASRMAGIPCVMHFHDIAKGLMLQVVRGIARIGSVERIACARTVADMLALKRTTVSYGPVALDSYRALPTREEARERLGLPKEIPIVAIVGRINRWKGHDRLLRIAAQVNRLKPVHFLIAGAPIFRDADFLPELKAMARDLKIEDRVSFLPWVEDVRWIYAAIDVNVNCSTREPFGRSIPEAAAAGVPSVCFDDSGAAETIFNRCTGRVVAAGDEGAFADALVELVAHSALPETRALVRHSALRFDAKVIAEDIAEVIRRAARPRSRVAAM